MKGAAGSAEAAFEELVGLHRARIFRFALASLRDRDVAESVTQDCFLRAHKGWAQFRGDASAQTWLMQIAVNLIRDAARSRRFQFWRRAASSAALIENVSDFIPDAGMSPEERASAAERVRAVWGALDGLSPHQRTVFLLHFMEDMNAAEIEAVCGISKAAIKVHLFRAVLAVRHKLRRLK